MLDQGIPETYQAHPLQYKDGVYALGFETEWAKRRLVLGMRASVGVTDVHQASRRRFRASEYPVMPIR